MDDQPDFDRFVETHAPALLRLAYASSGDAHLAEDLVQQVLIRAHGRWRLIDSMAQPHAYLRQMVVHELASWRRRWQQRRTVLTTVPERPAPDAMTAIDDRALCEALLARLPGKQRLVLALRYLDDVPDDEIARLVGCSEGTVRSHASRGLATLRAQQRRSDLDD